LLKKTGVQVPVNVSDLEGKKANQAQGNFNFESFVNSNLPKNLPPTMIANPSQSHQELGTNEDFLKAALNIPSSEDSSQKGKRHLNLSAQTFTIVQRPTIPSTQSNEYNPAQTSELLQSFFANAKELSQTTISSHETSTVEKSLVTVEELEKNNQSMKVYEVSHLEAQQSEKPNLTKENAENNKEI